MGYHGPLAKNNNNICPGPPQRVPSATVESAATREVASGAPLELDHSPAATTTRGAAQDEVMQSPSFQTLDIAGVLEARDHLTKIIIHLLRLAQAGYLASPDNGA
jgi:hypothetical protein